MKKFAIYVELNVPSVFFNLTIHKNSRTFPKCHIIGLTLLSHIESHDNHWHNTSSTSKHEKVDEHLINLVAYPTHNESYLQIVEVPITDQWMSGWVCPSSQTLKHPSQVIISTKSFLQLWNSFHKHFISHNFSFFHGLWEVYLE